MDELDRQQMIDEKNRVHGACGIHGNTETKRQPVTKSTGKHIKS